MAENATKHNALAGETNQPNPADATSHRRQGPPWLWDLLAIGVLAMATAGFFWRQLSGTFFTPADGGDLVSFLLPIYTFAQDSLRAGHLPLWNPHLYLGAPHVAEVQGGWLYPPTLLTLLLTPRLSYLHLEQLSIAHIWWTGVGTYVLLRSLTRALDDRRLSRWAALAAALAFMFADPLLVHFGNTNLLAVASWLPWVVWAFLRTGSARHPWRATALAGLLLGIGTLAGHPQTSLTIVLALAILSAFLAYFALTSGRGWRAALAPVGRLLLVVAIAGLLAAPILLPAVLHTPYTARAAFTYGDAAQYSLSPAQWIGLVLPAYFGRSPGLHWGPWDRVEMGYLGILPLALALLAIVQQPGRRVWLWLGLALTAFVLALGIYALPHGWLTLLPGFGQTRAPARLLLLTDLGLAVLAGYGLDGLLRAWSAREAQAFDAVWRIMKWITAGVVAVGVPLSYLALMVTQDASPATFLRAALVTIGVVWLAAFCLATLGILAARRFGWARPAVIGALACALIFFDVSSMGAYLDGSTTNPASSYQQPALVEFLTAQSGTWRLDARTDIDQLWQPNTALMVGLDDVWGVANPLVLADVVRYWDGIGPQGRSSPLYDFLNAQFLIGRKDVPLDWSKYELAFDGAPELAVFRNRAVLPRAFLVYQATSVTDQEAAWEAIHRDGFDPGREVVVEGGATLQAPPEGAVSAPVEIVAQGPNASTLIVQPTAPAYLVISQPFYPGWQAVDQAGREVPIVRANFAFQALAVGPETQSVTLRFAPSTWTWGLVLAGIGVLIVVAGMVAGRRGS